MGISSAMRWRLKPPCESLPGDRSCSRSKMELISRVEAVVALAGEGDVAVRSECVMACWV